MVCQREASACLPDHDAFCTELLCSIAYCLASFKLRFNDTLSGCPSCAKVDNTVKIVSKEKNILFMLHLYIIFHYNIFFGNIPNLFYYIPFSYIRPSLTQ